MKRITISIVGLLICYSLTAQVNKFGVPLVRNYTTEDALGSEFNYCMTSDQAGIMYYGSLDKGVLRYDGSQWTSIDVGANSRIYTLKTSSEGVVFVGGSYEFGYLAPDVTGKISYVSLSDRLGDQIETGIIYTMDEFKGKIYFSNLTTLFSYDSQADSLTWIRLDEKFEITKVNNMVALDDFIVLADNRQGLFSFDGENVKRLPGGEFFSYTYSFVLLPYGDKELIVGTFNQKGAFLYNYKSGVVREDFFEPGVKEILEAENIYVGTNLVDGWFALGTTSGAGIMIFDQHGVLRYKLDGESSTMGDVTIYSLYHKESNSGELWAISGGFISKIYLNIPYTVFDAKSGIETGINRIAQFNGKIYLSTDWGVAYSSKDASGRVVFKPLSGIEYQVFPLEPFSQGNKKVLLAGSNSGLYSIDENNSVTLVNRFKDPFTSEGFRQKAYNISSLVNSQFIAGRVYVGTVGLGVIAIDYRSDNQWYYGGNIKDVQGTIRGLVEESASSLWVTTEGPVALVNITISGGDTIATKADISYGLNPETVADIQQIDGQIVVLTKDGIYRYNKEEKKFVDYNDYLNGYSKGKAAVKVFPDADGDIWYSGKDDVSFLSLFQTGREGVTFHRSVFNILPSSPIQDIQFIDGRTWVALSKNVYVIDKDKLNDFKVPVNTLLVRITVGNDSIIMEESFPVVNESGPAQATNIQNESDVPHLDYGLNDISFRWTTTYYVEEEITEYSFMLEGFDNRWSKWSAVSFKDFTNLSSGNYIFRLKSRTSTGLESHVVSYKFSIKRAWYATFFAFFIYAVLTTLLVLAIIKAYTRRLKNENIRLEGIVTERTQEVVKQKEELESSIHYASRIQRALLPSENVLSENLNNYFILFKPRDIVSGDFFWMSKREERLFIVAADCTGHGVPGAFMSLLGISFLDEIINQPKPVRADEVLNELRAHVTESLKQVGDDDEAKDGMDIAILVIDFKRRMIEFSGAYNPCFILRRLTDEEKIMKKEGKLELPEGSMANDNHRLDTIFSDKMPIGISSRMKDPFTLTEWELEKDITYYLFSDGYVDQFGGADGRKFMKKNFKKLLLEVQDMSMEKQKEVITNTLMEWMGDSPQIDDILVVGLRPE